MQALARVLELEEIIGRLQKVRDTVDGFTVDKYENAGAALWAGQQRRRFTETFHSAKSSHSRTNEQIRLAIEDCKSKQRALAFSINAIDHPDLAAQAIAIALT
ncbi:hypothetical protein [Leifsonia xyli]|uniref:hypothetical protein n=1 Tax=Leifsonia xyli TaxID=1575 RepID=UPI003D67B281